MLLLSISSNAAIITIPKTENKSRSQYSNTFELGNLN